MRRFGLLVAGLALLAGVAATVSGGATQAKARWVITDLGTLGGSESGVGEVSTYHVGLAGAINERGEVVGWADTRDGRTAFLWKSGHMRALGLDLVADINERGQVAGSIRLNKHERAALWEGGKTRVLGTLSGKQNWWTEAVALNDRGQVTGNDVANRNDTIWRGFLWKDGKMTDLGTLGATTTSVDAINNQGQIVGLSNAVSGGLEQTHAFLWENGKMHDLGTRFRPGEPATINERGQVPGVADGARAAVWERGGIRVLPNAPGVRGVRAEAINEAGTIAGVCTVPPARRAHPCLWRDGKALDLGLVYGDSGKAVALNDRDRVIGVSRTGRGPFHAFVWVSGKMTDLGTLPGGNESQALAINNRGQIIGWSETKTGSQHAVLWTLKRG